MPSSSSFLLLFLLLSREVWSYEAPKDKQDVFASRACPAFLSFTNAAYLAGVTVKLPCLCKPQQVQVSVLISGIHRPPADGFMLFPLFFRSNQSCGSSGNIWAAPRRPELWAITMTTSSWTPVRSLTAVTCGADSPSVSSVCWSSGHDPTTRASTSAAPPRKTSSMVTTWTCRRRRGSSSLWGDFTRRIITNMLF